MLWGHSVRLVNAGYAQKLSHYTATARPRVRASAPPTWPLLPRCLPLHPDRRCERDTTRSAAARVDCVAWGMACC
eukprot:2540976-Prymnesium_polylepis.2